MKRKMILLYSVTAVATISIALIASVHFSSPHVVKGEDIVDQTITFAGYNEATRHPVTPHGNEIKVSLEGTMKNYSSGTDLYIIDESSYAGYVYTITPFQSISQVQFSFDALGPKEASLKVGSTKGAGDAYSNSSFVTFGYNYTDKVVTANITNPANAHYVTIYFKGWAMSSRTVIRWMKITYSCSY